MNIHNFEIDMQGPSVAGSTVKMDGKELDGVLAFEVPRVAADSHSVVKIDLMASSVINAIAALDLTLSVPESLPFDPTRLMYSAMADVDGIYGEVLSEQVLKELSIRFLELVIENSGIEDKGE